MPTDHREIAFEAAIEAHLLENGYTKADPANFDSIRGLDPTILLPFIQETQPKEWDYLKNLQKEQAEETLLEDLCKALNSDNQGCLRILRHGFKCFGKTFKVAFFAPASGMNPDTQRQYSANRLTVTRQVVYSDKHGNSLDLVLSLNGIPIVTAELKNPMTGQNWTNAVYQYKHDRDPKDLIFQFKKQLC